ncbi:MAG: PglZ domain-containing protein, partial [Tolypothrix sp. T3-bin4]|nr:PglZ domain-containing protein [Tolypothrix sp. T3-bin4]
DLDKRYRDLCLEMADEKRVVIDASESSITSREEAINALTALGRNEIEQLLIYVPAAKPIEEEEKQKDPFSLYSACGAVFPNGDGDSYLSLCLKAKPDHQTQVRAVFEENHNPEFAVIDAIGSGLGWPNLRALLRVESTRDILFALLFPNEKQQNALKGNESWVSEVKELLRVSIGLQLKTKGKAWSSIADELWRYLLFSEFVFDLPEALPMSLTEVPHAEDAAKPLIEDICERLRSDRRTQNHYISRAETIENELNLVDACKGLQDLGIRDTFPFEERTFLRKAISYLLNDNIDQTREVLSRNTESVWTGKGESQVQWDFLRSSLILIENCQDNDRALSGKTRSMEDLIDFYISQLREVDQRHREFEQSVSDYTWQDTQGIMAPVQEYARKQYAKLIEKVQFIFTKHFQQTGWPVTGRLANVEVFDKVVAPKLEISGNKVAFIMVDALRYELGIALEKQLSEDYKAEITPALVQLPSITPVGMASLLPGASTDFRLIKNNSGFVPHINGQAVGTVNQRMEFIRRKYGNRFQEGRLEEFVRRRFDISPDTDLLVLRSVEIDNHFENNPDTAPTEIINALKRIRVAIHKLKEAGFAEAIIATDHGFFMNTHAGPGDTCTKLSGNWINIHERSLLGDGPSDSQHFCLNAEKAGISSDYKNFAGPLSLASYKSGLLYYHGGCSLQECIVPVIQLHLTENAFTQVSDVKIELTYKNGAKRITTRLPVIEIAAYSQSLFSADKDFEILLEAYDKKGNVIGEAKPGGAVNPATGAIMMRPGKKEKITFKMNLEYEGKFKIKALNPTTMATYDQLELETDYTV